ncbi:hypothetical protein QR685DRAFT_194223, partial [Neurospora intermedia]
GRRTPDVRSSPCLAILARNGCLSTNSTQTRLSVAQFHSRFHNPLRPSSMGSKGQVKPRPKMKWDERAFLLTGSQSSPNFVQSRATVGVNMGKTQAAKVPRRKEGTASTHHD